jgi:eukaryotic-like serine/threonine-protein kinase
MAEQRQVRWIRVLGRGAHGEVRLAEVTDAHNFSQVLAVKTLAPEISGDAELAARLRDEARLLALLNHDHVVRVHGLTEVEGNLAVLMEFVPGADLSEVGPMPPRAVAEAIAAVAEALSAAWATVPEGQQQALRVVHRDIKPSNLRITPRGIVKVLDFGVARAHFGSREMHTIGRQFGTARYMAPERWLLGRCGPESDVFSLALTATDLLTGQVGTPLRLDRAAYEDDRNTALEGVPEPLLGLLKQATAWAPELRPTASEVVRRARLAAPELPGPGLASWAAETVPGTSAVQDTIAATLQDEAHASPEATPPPRARRATPLWLGAAGLLGLVVASVWALPLATHEGPAAPHSVPKPTLDDAPGPTPAPALAPPPRPSPDPQPAIAPGPTEPRTTRAAPVPDVAPSPKLPEEPAPQAETAQTVPVTFELLDGATVRVDGQLLTEPRRALLLPVGTASLVVQGVQGVDACEIQIGPGPSRVVVGRNGCSQ